MKPRRCNRDLPRYVRPKWLKSNRWGYFFEPPTWSKKAGCTVQSEALGTDYDSAVNRAETVLLPAFDSWRTRGTTDHAVRITVAAPGTLDWLFGEYRADRRFTKLDENTRRKYEVSLRMVGGYILKDGRRLGQVRLTAIDSRLVDDLYDKLLIVRKTDAAGNQVVRERRTTINHAMKTCRRAWNVALRRHPRKVPALNPFAKMGLASSKRETPAATYAELEAFRSKAREMGYPSLATAALIGWEWMQRENAIFTAFDVMHYRPKDRPDLVRIVHPKTGEEVWHPLFDDAGAPVYPELMAELDAIKRERIGGLMIVRDWGDRRPWPTDKGDVAQMSRTVKEIIRAAGLRDELTFTSFRHGGFTEGGDAELTDQEIMAQGGHRSRKVLPRYVKRTLKQMASAAKKRRATRTNGGLLSE